MVETETRQPRPLREIMRELDELKAEVIVLLLAEDRPACSRKAD